jgi:hypothetical protein
MPNGNDWPPPTTVLAVAALVGVVGAALYFIIPVLAMAIALCIKVSTTGLATAGAVGAWVAPVASAGVAVVGVTAAAAGIKKVSDAAQEKPYEWGLPLLAAFGGFASTLAKDTGLESVSTKWLFGGITSLLIVVAGACYKRPALAWKSVAVALYLLPPSVLLGWSTLSSEHSTIFDSFAAVSKRTWMDLGLLLVIGVLIGVLAHFDSMRPRKLGV